MKKHIMRLWFYKKRDRYNLEEVLMICIGLSLPPWLSEILLDRANLRVDRTGGQGIYGFILDCLYMDTVKTIRAFLELNGLGFGMWREEDAG